LAIYQTAPRVDLVLTDQAMPDMTGTDLIKHLRLQRPELRAVLASGYGELSGNAEGALPRLVKPFRQSALAAIVTAVLKE
jgi:YesN/AraC family two-component response regulator